MCHGIVKDQWTRREVVVFSENQDNVILDLNVTVFVSDSWGDFVNLYEVPNGRHKRTDLTDDQSRGRSLSTLFICRSRGCLFFIFLFLYGKGKTTLTDHIF